MRKQRDSASSGESRSITPDGSIFPGMRGASPQVRFSEMRRARFYILILGLTLLPQVVAASDLVRWLAAQGQLALGLSVPGLLLALNLPMLAEVLRRKKSARLPRFLAATVQTPWTAFWLGSLFYAILRAGWTVAHLGPAPMPVWLVGTSRGTQSAAFVATEVGVDRTGRTRRSDAEPEEHRPATAQAQDEACNPKSTTHFLSLRVRSTVFAPAP